MLIVPQKYGYVVIFLDADLDFLRCITSGGIAGPDTSTVINIFQEQNTNLHSDYINLHSHQHCIKIPSTSILAYFLHDGHSDWKEMDSQQSFNLHSYGC